ncbi:MAG: glycosyltransferase family 4 protein [Microthrixaceae bacterium]
MRIGLVCPYSLTMPGGVQNQVMAMAASLRRRGHEAQVLAPCDGPPPQAYVSPLGASVRQPSNGSIAPIAPDPAAQFRTIGALAAEDFDVLHLHEPGVPGPSLTALFVNPAPIVATFHAAGEQRAYGIFAPLARRMGTHMDVKVAVSPDAHALAAPAVGGDWVTLFNGIDRTAADVPAWPKQGPTVFFLGRHEPRKGLEVLLEALAHTETEMTVWIAGEGEATQQLRSRHTDPRIIWLGRIDDIERDRRMVAADVFCAPSLGGESFGIILLEALAAGTAVVASAIGGYEKVATAPAPDGSVPAAPAAVLFQPGNAPALAASLEEVLANHGLADSLRESGLERAAAFDMELLVDRYEELYARAAGSRAS